jgi:uncharacterized protein YfaS (alpha-2-macroglobulin family)
MKLLCSLLSLLSVVSPLKAAPREAEWEKVNTFLGRNNPRSALEALQPIEAAALAEKAWPEAAKALALRLDTEWSLEEDDDPAGRMTRMEAELAKAPAEMHPVLLMLQAQAYYEYFDDHRWEIMRRTRTGDGIGEDITTWDLPRLLAETDARFQKALAAAATLKQTPVAQWEPLIEKGGLPDTYQPTLYDFLARQALEFYAAGEQAGAEEANAFRFAVNSPALGTMEEFLAWQPGEGIAPALRAIRLYQELITFHKDDADPAARVLLDIERLEWAAETATGEGAAERKLEQLRALIAKHRAHQIVLRANSSAAEILLKQDKPAEALALLNGGVVSYVDSAPFAARCRNQMKQIQRKELSVSTEMVWNAAGPEIVLTSRNVSQAFFRLWLLMNKPTPEKFAQLSETLEDEEELAKLLQKEPARKWTSDLPGAEDFKKHGHRQPAPVDLTPGLYLIAVSGDEAFSQEDNMIAVAPVLVSPLALVTRIRAGGRVEGWTLDAVSGDPASGAEVTIWSGSMEDKPKRTGAAKSDANGMFSLAMPQNNSAMLFAKHGAHFAAAWDLYPEGAATQRSTETFFFTDRAIYRPGQTIQFKGIHVHADTGKYDYRVLPNVKRRVVLRDANQREVAALELVTNAYGSFSGSFTAPRQGLTGWFSIADAIGTAQLRVEEYKRPKFQVEVAPPVAAPKLGGEIAVKVQAKTYAGAPVDGADVKWRVTRSANWPGWVTGSWWWRYPDIRETEIAHGTGRTGADGSLEIKFTAAPDAKAAEKDEPSFTFSVHADVTDTAGETRSGQRGVSAGYTALRAEVYADEWQTIAQPVAFALNTTTLDGEPQKAEGTLTIHRLTPPDKVHRPPHDDGFVHYSDPARNPPEKDLSNPDSWENGEVVQTDQFTTDDKGEATVPVKLATGAYRAMLETKDAFGKTVKAQTLVLVVDPAAEKFPVCVPFYAGAPEEMQPGSEFTAVWGTGYDKGRAFIEVEQNGKALQRFWSDAARTQQSVTLPVTEEQRGGFTLHITQMRENRLSTDSRTIDVPWTNKDLTLKWEHLTSKLQPGAIETWTLSVAGPDNEKIAAEMVAVLYDASLDAFRSHAWPGGLYCFRSEDGEAEVEYTAGAESISLEELLEEWNAPPEPDNSHGRAWFFDSAPRGGPHALSGAIIGAVAGGLGKTRRELHFSGGAPLALSAPAAAFDFTVTAGSFAARAPMAPPVESPIGVGDPTNRPQNAPVSARKNMQETAFFFPHLLTAEDGTLKLEFTMPEAVTTWKFLGFAHDKALRSGFLSGETVTSPDLMVQPNPPRFLREGDTVEFTVKITNQSDAPQKGTAELNITDAATLTEVAAMKTAPQSFEVPAKQSRTVAWRITVPDGQGFLTWKATAATNQMSDGEEGWLPVLPRRVLVTESLPLTMRGAGEKEFTFTKLAESAGSESLQHQSLTVQMTSQPAWYAVMALPYLMEFPHECSEQTFHRFYANALARHLAQSDPKIRRTFDLWRDAQPEALESPLLKNSDLTSLLAEETPWLREATKESEQRRNLGVLFDDNRLDSEMQRGLQKIREMQHSDGAWPWFPGGPGNDFITLTIVSGFGRLQQAGVKVNTEAAVQALDRLDAWIVREHAGIAKDKAEAGAHLDSRIALYLYARSFFLKQRPVPDEQKAAVDFYLAQARQHWTQVSRMSQANAALGLQRFGDKKTPAAILTSLKERSTLKEEIGRYWAGDSDTWRWNAAPVETQALMIEAFREIAKDTATADECAAWLLAQKRTQSWPTTKATADAVHALMLGGTKQFTSDALVSVALGGVEVKPAKIEAGTGFFERKFSAADIKPDMGTVKLEKKDKGQAWGSLHWRYLEDAGKVTAREGTPLKVTKSLFIKVNAAAGPELRPVTGKVKVGDELVVRLELRTDRDMEFVHLKDQRPSSVEPVNVLSGYRWQDRVGYYESTRDTASHFFFDVLPKGTHVLEYSARVQLRGTCQTGLATLQCMYAPEFSSHSAGSVLEVE